MNMTRKTLHSFIILRGYLFLFQFSTSLLPFFPSCPLFCTLRFGLAFVAKPQWLIARCLVFSFSIFLFSRVWEGYLF